MHVEYEKGERKDEQSDRLVARNQSATKVRPMVRNATPNSAPCLSFRGTAGGYTVRSRVRPGKAPSKTISREQVAEMHSHRYIRSNVVSMQCSRGGDAHCWEKSYAHALRHSRGDDRKKN